MKTSSDASSADLAPHLAIARARLVAWVGVDLRRGGVLRSVERHVARTVAAHAWSVSEYAGLLDRPGSTEARALIEAATVPHSWLFRDPAQLAALERALVRRPSGALRVLVAGCATGEDAYTVTAIALRVGHDVRVLAIDVNDSALESAREGRFGTFQSRELPEWASAHFARLEGESGTVASDVLRRRITFRRHSLVDSIPTPPDASHWDLVVCRNVLIYFERHRAFAIVEGLGSRLSPEGLLLLGASDVLAELPDGLTASRDDGRTVIHRCEARALVAPSAVRAIRPPTEARLMHERSERPSALDASAVAPKSDVDQLIEALDAGALDDARRLAERRLLSVDDGEARLLAGLVAFAREDLADATTHLRIACRFLPGSWVAWLHLALASERLGRWQEATEAFFRVPLATGEGEDLPRGRGELPETLRAARADLTRLALHRAQALQPGDSKA